MLNNGVEGRWAVYRVYEVCGYVWRCACVCCVCVVLWMAERMRHMSCAEAGLGKIWVIGLRRLHRN